MPINLQDTLAALRIADREAAFSPEWDRIMGSLPETVAFLEPGYVRWACERAYLPGEITELALQAARRISDDPALRALAWYCHSRLFGPAQERQQARDWPLLTAALGPDAGLFNMLLLLSGTPHMQEIHRARGVPAQVTRDTALDLKLNLETEDYRIEHGRWGIGTGILGWLLLHWRGELYRLGRLQFMPSQFRSPFRAYRHRSSGAVVALSEPDLTYRADGQRDGSAGIFDPDDAWTTTLEVRDGQVIGYPISPAGDALPEPISLPEREWVPVLTPSSPVLDIHIPAGEPMDFDLCGDSIRQALEFFPRHFPDKPFVGFACHSWILDTQFADLLPASSNLVRFQREMYLFPIPRGGGLIRRVFGHGFPEKDGTVSPEDLARLPRQTTMQRAFAGHLEAGGRFRGGGCFLMKEDVDWGSAYYRALWPF